MGDQAQDTAVIDTSDATGEIWVRVSAAAATGGATLAVSALGLVSVIGGLLVTAVSAFMLVKALSDLIEASESSLAKTVEDMTSNAMPKGQSWPILAQ